MTFTFADIEVAIRALPTQLNPGTVVFRVCNLEYHYTVFEDYGTSLEDQREIRKILGTLGDNASDLIKKNLDYVFKRRLTRRSDRWSKKVRALYTSESPCVAQAEIRHYNRNMERAAEKVPRCYDLVGITSHAQFKCLGTSHHPALQIKKTEKNLSQNVGDWASTIVPALRVKSVRARGLNHVIFQRSYVEASRYVDRFGIKTFVKIINRKKVFATRLVFFEKKDTLI